ncbi:MAG: DMT family transporter [Candidatus Eisenbacteria bacterium]|uniref:DMT family transporter n=1 Tax=Eiseniibacteriota bacterium TaxID=2212470 RepID=A0A849SQ08_UNCEI|nr:DMT family transporter [Candidatus Eisenbacteria bacterium]
MSRRPARSLVYAGMVCSALIAGSSYPIFKRTVAEIPAMPFTLMRFALAAAFMAVALRVSGDRQTIAPADRKRLWLAGILVVPINAGLFIFGIQWTKAAHGALLYALTPAAVLVITSIQSRRLPSPLAWVGAGLAFAGVLVLLLERGLSFEWHALRGDLLILIAVFAWAWYTALGRGLTASYGAVGTAARAVLYGTIAFAPFGLLFWGGFDPRTVSMVAWAGLVYLAWFVAGINFILWYWGVKQLSPAGVAVFANLQPLVAAGMAWWLLHEALAPSFWLSVALVLTGVAVTQRAAQAAVRASS